MTLAVVVAGSAVALTFAVAVALTVAVALAVAVTFAVAAAALTGIGLRPTFAVRVLTTGAKPLAGPAFAEWPSSIATWHQIHLPHLLWAYAHNKHTPVTLPVQHTLAKRLHRRGSSPAKLPRLI